MRSLRQILSAPWFWLGLAISLLAYLTPYAFDSNVFEAEFLDKVSGGNLLGGYWEYINTVRLNDNWRLAQIISPLLTLYIPKWLTALVTGIAAALTLYILTRLILQSMSTRQQRCLQALTLWAILLFLPWRNNMLVCIFTLNYVTVATSGLVTVYLALNYVQRFGDMLLCILTAVLTAIGHEQIALSCGIGMICAAFFSSWKLRRPLFLIGSLMLVLGTLWVLLSHLMVRVGSEITAPACKTNPARIIAGNFLVILLWGFTAMSFMIPCARTYIINLIRTNRTFTFFAVAASAGAIVSIFVSYAPRSAYWPQLCAIGGWGIILYPVLLKLSARTQTLVTVISLILFGILSLHAGTWVYRIGKAYSVAEVDLATAESGTVFCHPIYAGKVPRSTLGLTPNVIFMEPMVFHSLSERYGRPVAFVPAELEYVSIPATPDSIYRTAEDILYMRPTNPLNEPTIAVAHTAGQSAPITLLPFTHPSGTPLILIIPHRPLPSIFSLSLTQE